MEGFHQTHVLFCNLFSRPRRNRDQLCEMFCFHKLSNVQILAPVPDRFLMMARFPGSKLTLPPDWPATLDAFQILFLIRQLLKNKHLPSSK